MAGKAKGKKGEATETRSNNAEDALARVLDGLETTEEKLSLSDRFGLLLPFFAFDQETYLRIVQHHATQLGIQMPAEELRAPSLRFALERGTRSGRTARQACIAAAQDLAREEE